jgi:hypothetical protein
MIRRYVASIDEISVSEVSGLVQRKAVGVRTDFEGAQPCNAAAPRQSQRSTLRE